MTHGKLYTGGLPCSKDEIIPGNANKKELKSDKKAARSRKGKEAAAKPKGAKQVKKEVKVEHKASKSCEKVQCDAELEERCRKWVAEVAREKFENPDQLFIPHLLVP